MILAGDIGGTKTILALYKQDKLDWVCHKKESYLSANFASFTTLLEFFLAEETDCKLQSVCIGVAGPIVNGDCITTNLPWRLKRKEIARQTGTNKVCLLNDLEATAWGVLELPADDFVELNPEAKQGIGNKAVIAAGTGLGEAMMIWSNDKYHVVATEGGHTDFAPRNKLEIDLLNHLLTKYPEHVSYERIVCGTGIANIYQFLKDSHYAVADRAIELRMNKEDPAAVIGEAGVANEAPLCVKTLEIFVEIYGAETGNMALKCLPKAGIILAGGIATKILPIMKKGKFLLGFLAKGRYKSTLQNISIQVCLNPEAGLIGATSFAKRV